jgi:integrase
VRWGRLARNAADAADPPKAGEASRPESITWSADQLSTFLEETRGSRHWTAYLVLATTGLRRGEALGLRWPDLDLDAARASIRANRHRRQTHADARHTQDSERAAYGHPRQRHRGGAPGAP